MSIHGDNHGDGVGAEAQLTTKLAGRHTLVFGGEYRKDILVHQRLTFDAPYAGVLAQTENAGKKLGVYAQGEIAVGPSLLLNAGLRYDYHDGFGSTLSPRFGLIYGPTTTTTLKALYGRAYRAPSSYERDLEAPGFIKANPTLGPETIDTWELVAEQVLPAGLRAAGFVYLYDVDHLISQRPDGDGVLMFQNTDSVRARGLELELDGAYASGLLFRASWAIQRMYNEQTHADLDNSPRHLFS